MKLQKYPGIWLLIYNIILFATACILLYIGVKVMPLYKVFAITFLVGVLLINLHSGFRYYSYERERKKAEEQQRMNIVPGYCPDYWTRKYDGKNVVCKNEYVGLTNENEPMVYKFAGTQQNINLNEVAKMKNEEKCRQYVNPQTSWLELQSRCQVGKFYNETPEDKKNNSCKSSCRV